MPIKLSPQEYERYKKLVGMLGSQYEGERNNALSMITKFAQEKGVPVHELILGNGVSVQQPEQPRPQSSQWRRDDNPYWNNRDYEDLYREATNYARQQDAMNRERERRAREQDALWKERERQRQEQARKQREAQAAKRREDEERRKASEDIWGKPEWLTTAENCLKSPKISDWEHDFLQNIIARFDALTPKQAAKLQDIADKVAGKEKMGWWPNLDDEEPPWRRG